MLLHMPSAHPPVLVVSNVPGISEAFTTWGSVSNPRRVYVASSRKSGTGVKVPDSFDRRCDRRFV